MENRYDYQKYAVLYVDDEEMSLKYFTRAFKHQFRIFTAANAKEAYQLLEEHRDKVGLIMTDQRMPGEQGVQFLGRARQLHPHAIRILTTAYSDLEVAIEAVNSGAIYKYITKPWEVPDLEVTLKRALEFFMVQRERDLLLREKLSVLHRMMITDRVLSLGIVAARLDRHVRNSLLAVRSFLDVVPDRLMEQKADVEEARNPNYWKEFYAHTQVQLRRITELLGERVSAADLNRASRAEMVDVKETLGKALEKLNGNLSQTGVAVLNRVPSGLPPLMVEREKFERLLDLLLKEEIVSLSSGQEVVFSAQHRSGDEEVLEIEIKDNGPGLPRDGLRAVFDPFFARMEKRHDFGINLLACYFIVYHHGGKIDVRSEEGQGVTFTLTFPMQPKLDSSGEEEQAFLQRVLVNDAFWERVIAADD
ncbi:MAG TPA: response regulator [Candidatus Binatia bacterium]|nr:response regulator [Candidatus Binatia bacterium]